MIATDAGLAVCAYDAMSGLGVYLFDAELINGKLTATAHGSFTRVPRISRAEISSCRLAYASETNQVAVAWQESVPPSVFRNYVAPLQLE